MKPKNLRILPRHEWPFSTADSWRGTVLLFDGDAECNDYRLLIRHIRYADTPLKDRIHSEFEYVPDPNGSIHPNKQINEDGTVNRVRVVEHKPRRTWTQVGGLERGTMRSRTQANEPLPIYHSELGDGPWQVVIDKKTVPDYEGLSNAIIVEPLTAIEQEQAWKAKHEPETPTREGSIDKATVTFDGKRTKREKKPYVRQLRKHADMPDITTGERDASHERVSTT